MESKDNLYKEFNVSARQSWVQGNKNIIYNTISFIISHLLIAAVFKREWAHRETGPNVSTYMEIRDIHMD